MKKIFKFAAAAGAVMLLASCTANFCTNKDKASMWYAQYGTAEQRKTIVDGAKSTVDVPHEDFWAYVDAKTIEVAKLEGSFYVADIESKQTDEEIVKTYGYVMFLDNKYGETSSKRTMWSNFDKWVDEAKLDNTIGIAKSPNKDFIKYYKTTVAKASSGKTACITPTDGVYGPDGTQIAIEAKTWGDAWDKGIIEGLLVYPVSLLVNSLTVAFGANGWGQLLALLITTVIVRGLLLAATFKSTMATQKMTALKPELDKIQQKYPNSQTNQYEKSALSQEQMALYKKHKINPFSQILVMILQFPVFIAMWGALQGTAIMSSGSVLGLNLNASLGQTMMNFSSSGCITAIILFILMSVAQLVSMKLPQWIQAKKSKKNVTKLGKNPSADSQGKQMKMVNNVMLIMIIVMGFSLPAAMGVYWLIGALISITQTLVMQKVMGRHK